jgi:putative ABC transport system permease protein
MNIIEIFFESLGTLTLNRMRTGLAVLGIVIGIGSVIALISLGQASQKSVETQIQSLGSNLLTVRPGAQTTGGIRGEAGGSSTLTNADAEAISASPQITTIKNVSPEVTTRLQVVAGSNNTNTQIAGVTPTYAEVHKVTVESGSFISEQDVKSANKVAVLGPQVVSDLFGEGASAISKTIRISNISFRVIGVTASKGGTGFMNQDDMVFVSLTVAQRQLLGVTYLNTISLEAKSPDVMTNAQNEVGYLLLARHKLSDPTQADFSIFSQNDILNTASQMTGIFTALLGGIAAISLLVGGIGIMNIMLVTVTERTREIGLRKALGANKKIVVTQFLIEAIVLTFTGGVLGIALGVTASFFLSKFLSMPFTVSPSSLLLAFGVSGATGIVFGWYPAQKAAGLQPIEALRHE